MLLSILGNFFPFYLTSSPKRENFKTMKKAPGDIIILQKCTKNPDHMLYCPWDMPHDTCNCCFSFWAIFSCLPSKQPKKTKFQKSKKNHLEISSFYTCVPKIMIRWSTVPEIWWATAGRTEKVIYRGGSPPKNFITLKYQVLIYYKNFIKSTLLDIGPKAFS